MKVHVESLGAWNRGAYKGVPDWVFMYLCTAANGLIAREDIPSEGTGMPLPPEGDYDLPDEDWSLEKTDWDKVVPDEDEVYV